MKLVSTRPPLALPRTLSRRPHQNPADLTRSQAKPLDNTVVSSISTVPYRKGDLTAPIIFDETNEEDRSAVSDQCDDVTDGFATGSGDWRWAE